MSGTRLGPSRFDDSSDGDGVGGWCAWGTGDLLLYAPPPPSTIAAASAANRSLRKIPTGKRVPPKVLSPGNDVVPQWSCVPRAPAKLGRLLLLIVLITLGVAAGVLLLCCCSAVVVVVGLANASPSGHYARAARKKKNSQGTYI